MYPCISLLLVRCLFPLLASHLFPPCTLLCGQGPWDEAEEKERKTSQWTASVLGTAQNNKSVGGFEIVYVFLYHPCLIYAEIQDAKEEHSSCSI